MPTNVELFDMLEPGILAGMTNEKLLAEMEKTIRMLKAVKLYHDTVSQIAFTRVDTTTPTSHSSGD